MTDPKQQEQTYFNLNEVLLDELETILAERADGKTIIPEKRKDLREQVRDPEQKRDEGDHQPPIENWKEKRDTDFGEVARTLNQEDLSALCLSGGGIRSATFNLGVLQSLAKCGVLKEIDYLSTVSGGGYIGSWLSSWILREGKGAVFDALSHGAPDQSFRSDHKASPPVSVPLNPCKEPYQVRFLRDYSNYLTPRVGILSIDTWAIIGTYLRNLVLNWMVLLPLFFAILLLPRFLSYAIGSAEGAEGWAIGFLVAGGIMGMLAVAYTAVDLPSFGDGKKSKGCFAGFFLGPVVLMACALSAFFVCAYGVKPATVPSMSSFIVFAIVVHAGGWIAGQLWLLRNQTPIDWRKRLAFLGCAVGTGVVAGWLGWATVRWVLPEILSYAKYSNLGYLILCVPIVLVIFLLTGALLVAVLSRSTSEPDREWWGRAAGTVLLAGLFWGIYLALVYYGPWLLLVDAFPFWKWLWAVLGGGSGIAAALMGKAPSTPAPRPGAMMTAGRTSLPAAVAAIFILFLALALSLLGTASVEAFHVRWGGAPVLPHLPGGFDHHANILLRAPSYSTGVLFWGSLVFSLLMAWAVNINTFSLHAMYRDRLVRCYLGASRPEERRKPNPFTGFDPEDDLYMKQLPRRPFHVINVAWNLVKGKRLAWQQRKATSFVMTPLVAGGDLDLPLNPSWDPENVRPGGFRPIGIYGGGRRGLPAGEKVEESAGKGPRDCGPLKLGTAMAISGAAASPNMGYHSSPLVTFVMAFFDVRLGWWLGNPGKGMGGTWTKESPKLALLHLIKETFGLTTEESPFIYLSDGGHFENLGLYEMVRRRCRHIIVCDAGCDCDATFEDLGNAIRKVRADFGIEIDINVHAIHAKKAHFAVGSINYGQCDKACEDGCLLYIKPVLTDDEPVDDFNYWKTHPGFPHETTADQWFDEAQFESYRRLGVHSLEPFIEKDDITLEVLFEKARRLHPRALREALKAEHAIKGGKLPGQQT